MTNSNLQRRLRKMEARTGLAHGPWFFVFGRDAAEIQAEATAAPVGFIPIAWAASEPVPAPRWASATELSDAEMLAVLEAHAGPVDTWRDAPSDPRVGHLLNAMPDSALLALVLAPEARP